jgi:LacI family transcriptional regulator
MRPTIKDVAIRANVSTATVSLVIHGNSRISPETKRTVNKAVKDLGYYPSRSARDLASKKTGNIGFILTEDHFLKTEPFYTQIFLGTEFEARKYPYYVLLGIIPANFSKKDDLPRFFLERSVDGIIVAGKVPQEFFDKIKPYNRPMVIVDYYISDNHHSSILIDNIGGAISATQYLVSLGHKTIAFLGGDLDHPSIRDRYHGYKICLEQNIISFDKNLVVVAETSTSREAGYHAAQTLHKRGIKYSAVFACNDAMAIGAMNFYKEQNIRIPDEISILGFDNIERDLYQEPTLSTMSVPKIDMGQDALQLIVQKIDKKINGYKKILIPVELIIRNSTKAV